METDLMCIRKAQPEDINDLFWLLHGESICRNFEQITTQLASIYVMTCAGKLIGATCRKNGETGFEWTAIHPMYPEKAMSDILLGSLSSIGYPALKLEMCCE